MDYNRLIAIARICHEANRAYCQFLNDYSQRPWDEAPPWQRDSAVKDVKFHLRNPGAGPSASHELPLAQQKKDLLFAAIVAALA